ncbi:MAG: DUF2267 domain-containing protein [Thermodesulfobacteriota bacterium]
MQKKAFFESVSRSLQCDAQRAEGLTLAVFQQLRDRLTPKEAADVAAQLPAGLKPLWQDNERRDRRVEKVHREEFLGRIRRFAGLPDDAEAERSVKVVFAALQALLGSPTGKEGEAWHIFSQLPKDLKELWLEAGAEHDGTQRR